MHSSRTAWLITLLLLVLGVMRIAWIVGHQPVLGYAYEPGRASVSACVGLWPDMPERNRSSGQREAPSATYVEGARNPSECEPASDLVFVSVAMAAWKTAADAELASPRAMDLRFVGAVKGISLVVLALVITFALRERAPWMIANAAVFGIVLADPLVTLWMNSLHGEYSTVWFCYAALGCLIVITGIAPERIGWYLALALMLVGLGFSRPQYAWLPIFLALLVLPVAWRYRRLAGMLVIVAATTVLVIQSVAVTRSPAIRAEKSVDVVLGTLLPASRAPESALAALQLPGRCGSLIGATARKTMGESVGTICPEAQALRTARLASLLAAEPAIFFRVMAKAAPLTQPALMHDLGIESGRRFAKLEDQQSPLARSIAQLTERLPLIVHVGWLMFVFAALAIAGFAWALEGIAWGTSMGPLATTALAGVAAYGLLSSVFGEGMTELTRHAHLAAVTSHALLAVGIVALLFGSVSQRSQRVVAGSVIGRPTSLLFVLSLFGAAVAIAMSSVIWMPAYRALPLGIGSVEEPAGNRLASRRAVLRGWALDPIAAPRAYAVVNETTRIDSRMWRPSSDGQATELARQFPGYVDAANAHFEIPIDTGSFGGMAVHVKTYAVNSVGASTEIDRRTLLAPTR